MNSSYQKVIVGGSSINYIDINSDSKDIIVMLHGFRGNHKGLLLIAKNLPAYRIIIPDLPGYGNSEPMINESHDISGYAHFSSEFIATLGLGNIILIGHSFGALVAAEATAEDIDGVIDKLILINPVSSSGRMLALLGLIYYKLGFSLPANTSRKYFNSKKVSKAQSFLMMKTKDKQLRKRIYEHHLEDLKSPFNSKVIEESVNSVINGSIMVSVPKLRLPVLIIGGAEDDLAPVAQQNKLFEALRRADPTLKIIPEVGHLTHIEKPKEVADLIKLFLA